MIRGVKWSARVSTLHRSRVGRYECSSAGSPAHPNSEPSGINISCRGKWNSPWTVPPDAADGRWGAISPMRIMAEFSLPARNLKFNASTMVRFISEILLDIATMTGSRNNLDSSFKDQDPFFFLPFPYEFLFDSLFSPYLTQCRGYLVRKP